MLYNGEIEREAILRLLESTYTRTLPHKIVRKHQNGEIVSCFRKIRAPRNKYVSYYQQLGTYPLQSQVWIQEYFPLHLVKSKLIKSQDKIFGKYPLFEKKEIFYFPIKQFQENKMSNIINKCVILSPIINNGITLLVNMK